MASKVVDKQGLLSHNGWCSCSTYRAGTEKPLLLHRRCSRAAQMPQHQDLEGTSPVHQWFTLAAWSLVRRQLVHWATTAGTSYWGAAADLQAWVVL